MEQADKAGNEGVCFFGHGPVGDLYTIPRGDTINPLCVLDLIFKEGSVVVPAQGSKKGFLLFFYYSLNQTFCATTSTFTVSGQPADLQPTCA